MDYWEKTVTLRLEEGRGAAFAVSDSKSAARVLLRSWPERKGKSYRRAVLNCSAALRGQIPQDLAQWSFIVAAMEADISYEIGDRFDMEIAEVCRELLGDYAPQELMKPVRPAVELAAVTQPFWWPKRQACGPSAR